MGQTDRSYVAWAGLEDPSLLPRLRRGRLLAPIAGQAAGRSLARRASGTGSRGRARTADLTTQIAYGGSGGHRLRRREQTLDSGAFEGVGVAIVVRAEPIPVSPEDTEEAEIDLPEQEGGDVVGVVIPTKLAERTKQE